MQTIPRTAPSATAKQIDFITDLIYRVHGENGAEALLTLQEEVFPTMTRAEASAHIDRLLKTPREEYANDATLPEGITEADPDTPEIPAGRYALTVNGEIAYYKVDRPKGIWDGWTFISHINTDGSNERAIRGPERKALIALIVADPAAASVAYGRKTGTCGMCSRTLIKQVSIDAGIGPVCAARL